MDAMSFTHHFFSLLLSPPIDPGPFRINLDGTGERDRILYVSSLPFPYLSFHYSFLLFSKILFSHLDYPLGGRGSRKRGM